MLLKIALLIAVVLFVYVYVKKKGKNSDEKDLQETLQCSKCNTFVTRKDAITRDNLFYCCAECLS